MADLEALVFSVDTTQLDVANKKIEELAGAISTLEQATKGLSSAEATAARTAAEAIKTKSELIGTNTALAKAENEAAKAASDTAQAAEKAASAVRKQKGAAEDAASGANKLEKLFSNLDNTFKDLVNGFTRGESGIMKFARDLGASANDLKVVEDKLKLIKGLTSNPFDNSLGSLRSITSELDALKQRAQLAKDEVFLTTKQLQEFSRISREIEGKAIVVGLDISIPDVRKKIDTEIESVQKTYLEKVKEVNLLNEQEKQRTDIAKKAVEEEARLNREREQEALQHVANMKRIREQAAIDQQKSANDMFKFHQLKQQQEEQTSKAILADMATYYRAQEAETNRHVNAMQAMQDHLLKLQQRTQRDTIAEKYVSQGASRSTANLAATNEMQGVPQADIDSFVKQAAAMDIAMRKRQEMISANKFVIETEQRLAAALDQTNHGLNQQSTDTLVKYGNALKATGVSADVAAAKMAALKNQLEQVVAKERAQQLEHLARAISVQMGDIAISLASGQNPLIVMIQQGDQIRGALDQAQAKGKELTSSMNQAAAQIATGFKNTAIAIGTFAFGAVEKLGGAITGLFSKMNPAQLALDAYVKEATASGKLLTTEFTTKLEGYQTSVDKVGRIVGIAGTVFIAFAAAAAAALVQTDTVQKELNKTITTTGALLGITTNEAMNMAAGMNVAGASSNEAASALSQVVNAGVRTKDSLVGITAVALELERYGGVSIENTAKRYAELGKDPVKVLTELGISTGLVTAATIDQVQALIDQGDKLGSVELATKSLDSANAQMVQSMKSQLTPLNLMFISIKDALTDVWQGVITVGNSTPIIGALRAVWGTLYAVVKGVATAVLAAGSTIIGLSDIGGKLLTGDFSGAKQSLKDYNVVLQGLGKDFIDGTAKAYGFGNEVEAVTQAIAKARQEAARGVEAQNAVNKSMKTVEDALKKQEEKTISLSEFQKKYREDRLKAAQAEIKYGTEVKFSTEELAKQDKVSKQIWEDLQKKDKKKKPREKLEEPLSNIKNLKQTFASELKVAEQYGKQQRQILKIQLEAGLLDRGEYIARDLALVTEGERQRRAILEETHSATMEDFKAQEIALKAEQERLKGSKLKGADEALKKVTKALVELDNTRKAFMDTNADKRTMLDNETELRYAESLKESNQALKEMSKSYDDFIKKQDDLVQQRKGEIESAGALSQLTGAQAAAYKAGGEAAKQMTSELSTFVIKAQEAKKVYDDFMSTEDAIENDPFGNYSINQAEFDKRQKALLEQKEKAQKLSDQAIAKSGEYIEKAKTDAVTKYYQEEVQRISEGLAGVLTTAIFDGGEAGAKALRGFIEQELRKKFMIEVQANLITPLVNQAFGALGLSTGSNVLAGPTTQGASGLMGLGSTVAQAATALGTSLSAGASMAMTGFSGMATAIEGGLAMVGSATGATSALAGMGQIAGALGPAAAALGLALNVLGVFRSKKIVGGGLTGTLGEGTIQQYDLQRRGGTLFSGPKYTMQNQQDSQWSNMIQEEWKRFTAGTLEMAKSLGLATQQAEGFTAVLGTEKVHPDIDAYGIRLDDINKQYQENIKTMGEERAAMVYNQEVSKKINEALVTGSNELAEKLIGSWATTTETVTSVTKATGRTTSTLEKQVYVQSEYARSGETAIETLTRLSTSLSTANKYAKLFGDTTYEGTLKGADAASTLADAFGGVEQFQTDMQNFYSVVASPMEQTIAGYTEFRSAIDSLGVEIPNSAVGMKLLANSMDLTTEAGSQAYATLIKVGPQYLAAGEALLQSFGTSTEELAGILVDGLRNSDPAGAGQYFADTIVYGIENALYQNMGAQITQIVTNGIIAPLMQSMLLGETAAVAISKLSIASVTQQVQDVTTFFSALFNNPEWITLMDTMKTGLAGVVGGGIGGLPMPRFTQPKNPWEGKKDNQTNSSETKNPTNSSETKNPALEAAKAANDAWESLLNTLTDRKLDADIQNIYLTQGKAAGLAAERAREYTSMIEGLTVTQEVAATETKAAYTITLKATDAQKAETATKLEAIYALEDYNKALEGLANLKEDAKNLEVDLLRALGKEEQALAKEREIAIQDMSLLEVAQYDLNKSTEGLIEQVNNLKGAFDAAWDSLATPEQKRSNGYTEVLEGIDKETGFNLSLEDVVGLSDATLLDLVGTISQMHEVSGESRTNLINLVTTLSGLNKEAREAGWAIEDLEQDVLSTVLSSAQLTTQEYAGISTDLSRAGLYSGDLTELTKTLEGLDFTASKNAILDFYTKMPMTQEQRKSFLESAKVLMQYKQLQVDRAKADRAAFVQERRTLQDMGVTKYASEEDSTKVREFFDKVVSSVRTKAYESYEAAVKAADYKFESDTYAAGTSTTYLKMFADQRSQAIEAAGENFSKVLTATAGFMNAIQSGVTEVQAQHILPVLEKQTELLGTLEGLSDRATTRRRVLEQMPDVEINGVSSGNRQLQQQVWDIEDAKPFIEERKRLDVELLKSQRQAALSSGDVAKAQELLNSINVKAVEELNAVELAQYRLNNAITDYIDAISTKSGLFDKFASDDQKLERANALVKNTFESLNLAVPKTAAEFLALSEAANPATVEGQTLVKVLGEVSEAFALTLGEAEKLSNFSDVIKSLNEQIVSEEIRNIYLTQGEAAGLLAERANELFNLTKGLNPEQAKEVALKFAALNVLKDTNKQLELFKSAMEGLTESLVSEEIRNTYLTQGEAAGLLAERANELTKLQKGLNLDQAEEVALKFAALNVLKDTNKELELFKSAMEGLTESLVSEEIRNTYLTQGEAAGLAAERANELTKFQKGLNLDQAEEVALKFAALNVLKDLNKALEQRNGLEDELHNLLGNTAKLREKELAALDPTNHALQQHIWAIEDSRTATDKALAAAERAIEAERKTLDKSLSTANESVSKIKGIFDILKDEVKRLYQEVDSTVKMGLQQGLQFVDTALFEALSTGKLPEQEALEDALSGIQKGMEDTTYTTQFEADRDRLVLAGKLNTLKDVSGKQLTEAEQLVANSEKALEQYEDMLKQYRDQIDTMRGIDVSVISVKDAVVNLQAAISSELSTLNSVRSYNPVPSPPSYSGAGGELTKAIDSLSSKGASTVINPDGSVTVYQNIGGMPNIITLPSGSDAAKTYTDLPAFAAGGSYLGGLALVGEEGPELINFDKPGQVYTASQTKQALGNDNAELVAEIRALREENKAQAGAIVRLQSQLLKFISRWDGDGMPETREVTA